VHPLNACRPGSKSFSADLQLTHANTHNKHTHVWKTGAPSLTASLVAANASLLIFLIIIVKVNSTLLADVLINCDKQRERSE